MAPGTTDDTPPGSCESPNSPHSTSINTLKSAFDRISAFASSWRSNATPHGRRIFHRDVERDEFQFANTYCLSSYYSVFVARLAIMVSKFCFTYMKLDIINWVGQCL